MLQEQESTLLETGPESSVHELTFRNEAGVEFRIESGPELQRVAMDWSYTVRNRQRWISEGTNRELIERARKDLAKIGLTDEKLKPLTAGRMLEVAVPFQSEESGWEARVAPWEFLLTAVTDKAGGSTGTVVRRLLCAAREAPAGPAGPLLIVDSAPGPLAKLYRGDPRNALLIESFGRTRQVEVLKDPTRDELEQKIRELQPQAVHINGFDTHEAAQLLGESRSKRRLDGILLRGKDHPHTVTAGKLARILNAGARKPRIVTFNLWNSAPRLAALAVAEGADAAIGFQDVVPDALAERFYAELYGEWTRSGGEAGLAFRNAFQGMRGAGSMEGSGVVLWTTRSILTAAAAAPKPAPTMPAEAVKRSPQELLDSIDLDIEPFPTLNYAMLHNHRGLFKAFEIRTPHPEPLGSVEILIELFAAGKPHPCRKAIQLEGRKVRPVREEEINIPLPWEIGPQLHESAEASLYVEVAWKDQNIYRNTFSITLLPPNEWRDDDENRIWLPSFVLPSDPAVSRIIKDAYPYLFSLADDFSAGFDGYQSFGSWGGEGIDLQVRALWSALIQNPLQYIEPPPTYSNASQRLRLPSQVVEERRGTCIDLALLLASCIEYIGLYPVLFLTRGHAFPGYWRDESAHQKFRTLSPPTTPGQPIGESHDAQTHSWALSQGVYPEILRYIQEGSLVPLETVSLTKREGFLNAVEAGGVNLYNVHDFETMLDIHLAREHQVTPLPIEGLRA